MKVQLVKAINLPTVMYAYPHLAVKPNSAVEVKFWARGVSNGANLTVMVRREIDPWVTYLRSEMNLTDEWQEYAFIAQLPKDADPNQTSLRFVLNQAGVFWIDDVSVIELPPADKVRPGSKPHQEPSFEAGTDGWTATFRKREFGDLPQESGASITGPGQCQVRYKTDTTAPDGKRFLTVKIDQAAKPHLQARISLPVMGIKAICLFSSVPMVYIHLMWVLAAVKITAHPFKHKIKNLLINGRKLQCHLFKTCTGRVVFCCIPV